jgi:hypothetical protein
MRESSLYKNIVSLLSNLGEHIFQGRKNKKMLKHTNKKTRVYICIEKIEESALKISVII